MFSGPAAAAAAAAPGATNAYLRHDDRIHHAIKVLTKVTKAATERLHGVLSPVTYENVAIDSVVESLSHTDLLDVAKAVMTPREVHSMLPSRIKSMKFAVRRSFIISRILSVNGQKITSPFHPHQAFTIDTNGNFTSASSASASASASASSASASSNAVAAIARINNNTMMAFKVLDPLPKGMPPPRRGAARSGCVCHQSSTISLKDLVRLISEVVPSLKEQMVRLNKRALCEVYEIVLRKHRPQAILRPL
jgi:predicted nuclease with RNAse H fold